MGFSQEPLRLWVPPDTLCCHLLGTLVQAQNNLRVPNSVGNPLENGYGMSTSEPPTCHCVSGKFLPKEIETQVMEDPSATTGFVLGLCVEALPPEGPHVMLRPDSPLALISVKARVET